MMIYNVSLNYTQGRRQLDADSSLDHLSCSAQDSGGSKLPFSTLLEGCPPTHPGTCKLDMPCLQGLAAQASDEHGGGPCKTHRQPFRRAKRAGGRQTPAQQVRLLMVCRSLAYCSPSRLEEPACLLPASAKKIAWFQAISG